MSHVCRRGGIDRHAIGAIDIGEETSSVEVSDEFAAEFERRCRKPDARDRNVHITLEGAASRGPAAPPERNNGAARGFAPRAPLAPPPQGARVKRAARGQAATRGSATRGPATRGPATRGASRGPSSGGSALAGS
jgi:hypothetical protein